MSFLGSRMAVSFRVRVRTPHRRDNRCHNATVTSWRPRGPHSPAATGSAPATRCGQREPGGRRDPEVLELRAAAAYGSATSRRLWRPGRTSTTFGSPRGDGAGAAWAAGMVAMYLMIDTGLMSPVRGWLRRAERLMAARPSPCRRTPWSRWSRPTSAFFCGDAEGAERQSRPRHRPRRAAGGAARRGDRAHSARAGCGSSTARSRRGLALLDEVAVQLMPGDVAR